ncbi:MAG: nitroreductase [Bacteroidetes bacterium HGW-Bacteroidetes-1]|nr:MAG: nitroreductase [Bacteroidetes bacterium HGW-Bacteroidetes-1]
MDFTGFVSSRYSVRSYDPLHPVEKEKLLRVLEAGRMAPSASNRQPWKIVIVQSTPMLRKLSTCYSASWFAKTTVVLIVKGNRSEAWTRKSDGYNSIETDLTILMDHLILAAHAEGLSTCWIAAFEPQKLREVLALSESEEVFAMMPLGYPVAGEIATRPKTRKTLDEITEWL